MNIFRSRTTLTLIAGLLAIFAVAMLRPEQDEYLRRDFMYSKIAYDQTFDIVLAGNSRVGSGISPAEMNKVLPGLSIHNFAFPGQGYNSKYLDAILERVDLTSDNKAIVLGVAPSQFTRASRNRSTEFVEFQDNRLSKEFEHSLRRFQPFIDLDIRKYIPNLAIHTVDVGSVCTPDGFAAIPFQKEFDASYSTYDSLLRKNKSLEKNRRVLLDYVERFTELGIQVYAVRVPTTNEMVTIESRHSRMHYGTFVKQFEKAGGKWLFFPEDYYESADGNHLLYEGALQFSSDLATLIATGQRAIEVH